MFSGCNSLLSIDFGDFLISKSVDMNNMFSGCSSLLTLNINFNLERLHIIRVTNINSMFYECSSLVSLDIRNFDTSQVTDMRNTFANCSSLKYLKIYYFETSSTIDMTNMFYGCSSFLSLNLNNFNTTLLSFYNDTFKNINKNLIYCIDSNNEHKLSLKLEFFIKDCNYICLQEGNKFFKEENICVDFCSSIYFNNSYKYVYNNTCFEKCPNGTYLNSTDSPLLIRDAEPLHLFRSLNKHYFFYYLHNLIFYSIFLMVIHFCN